MARPRPTRLLESIATVLAAGVPDGALRTPNKLFRLEAGAKLHGDESCCGWGRPEWVDLTRLPSGALCLRCVKDAPNPGTADYLSTARHVLAALDVLDALAVATAPSTGAQPGAADVSAAHAGLSVLRDVACGRHPELASFVSSRLPEAAALHARLHAAVYPTLDPDALVRRCVLDLMGHHDTLKEAQPSLPPIPTGTPDPVADAALPALRLGSNGGGRSGQSGVAVAAWTTWLAVLAATGDLAAARSAATQAGALPDGDEPSFTGQLPKGPTLLTHPADATPWQVLVAEWRHQGALELAALICFWERLYAADRQRFDAQPALVLALSDYDRDTLARAGKEPAAVLSQLPLAGSSLKGACLVLAAPAVAQWLCVYGLSGLKGARPRGVEVFTESVTGDTQDTLATALQLWDRLTEANADGIDLLEALAAARGILAPVG